jgi:hypothetical protein
MTRAELEAGVRRQLRQIAPQADAKAVDYALIVILAQADAYTAAQIPAQPGEA